MNLSYLIILTAVLQSPAALIDEAFQNSDFAKAEQLIQKHIPAGTQQTLLLARSAMRKNETAKCEQLYSSVLKEKNISMQEKTEAYVGLLRIMETKPLNPKNRKAYLALLNNAVHDLPANSNVQRMFMIKLADLYEKMVYEQPAGPLFHLLFPGFDISAETPRNKALQIYLKILQAKSSLPQQTVWTATYGAARMWRHAGQFEQAEKLLQDLLKTELPAIERGKCAFALTEHYLAVEPVWKLKRHPLWKQINNMLASPALPPEYKIKIYSKLASAALRNNAANEAFSYYNRAANVANLTPGQRFNVFAQHIAAANKAKQDRVVYNLKKRIYTDGQLPRWQRLRYMQSMINYLAQENDSTELNAILQYGQKSTLKLTSAEIRKYRKMYQEQRKKRKKKR